MGRNTGTSISADLCHETQHTAGLLSNCTGGKGLAGSNFNWPWAIGGGFGVPWGAGRPCRSQGM